MPTYCEAALLNGVFEPLNTVSNLAFIVSAYYVWRLARKPAEAGKAGQQKQLFLLAGLLAMIGLGSGLWHFFGEPWSLALDVIPIQLFLLTFASVLIWQIFSTAFARYVTIALFILASAFGGILISQLTEILGFGDRGGAGYVVPLVFAVGLVPFVWQRSRAKAWLFVGALGLFLFSLMLRQLDVSLCELTAGHGLHLFWHLLNAVVLYLFARVLMVESS